MSELFGRTWELEVVTPSGGRRWGPPLRVAFDVTKTLDGEANQGKVRIWNLSRESQRLVESDGASLILRAGYGNTVPPTVFVGDVDEARTIRDGAAEWVTELECRDGATALSTVVSISTRETDLDSLISEVVSLSGLPRGYVASAASKALKQGYHLSGTVREALNDLCRAAGLAWSVQDGEIQIVPDNEDVGEDAVLLSPGTGLVGAPVPVTDRDGGRTGVRVTSLLQATIRPGRLIQVEADKVSGIYVAGTVHHVGDSEGGEWYSQMEGWERIT